MPVDPAWVARLEARLDAPPARPRAALTLHRDTGAPPARIGTIESELAMQISGAGLPLRERAGSWHIETSADEAGDSVLARIAEWLRANGRAAAWRGELLAVADADDMIVGAIERAAVRPLGIATRAVHLVVRDEQSRVWVQQRAFDKSTDPGQWDTTMGGLVSAFESIEQTLERETWEEAGLRIDELQEVRAFGRFTVRRPTPEGYMVEHIEMFEATAPAALTPVNQDGEVARFEQLEVEALIDRLHADAFTLEAAMILVKWLEHREATTR